MSAFEVYKQYLALKKHFDAGTYDFFKYNGKVRASVDSFNKRKDKVFFEKLAKHPDVFQFLVANLSDNPKHWIRDLAYSEDAERTYRDWLKRNQSIVYNYKTDFHKIMEMVSQGEQQHPAAVRLFLGGDISLESLCIYCKITNALVRWDARLEYDPVWEQVRNKIVKYSPFVKFDHSKVKQIMVDVLEDLDYTK